MRHLRPKSLLDDELLDSSPQRERLILLGLAKDDGPPPLTRCPSPTGPHWDRV